MEYEYLALLNEAQKNAVTNVSGPTLVIAGAGSGKTRVLTYRIAHLLRMGNPPGSILSLTFTNKAAREMKERIASVVGNDISKYLWMGTFHSIFARILRYEHEAFGYPSTFTIYDSADSKNLIKTIIKSMQLDVKDYKPGTVLGRISAAKNNLITAQAYLQNNAAREYDASIKMPKIAEIYKEYARRCKIATAMDFDDLLLNTNLLFHNKPEILAKYQERFKYVLVDEYQDTNYSQYLIVKKLSEKNKNICVVGDDAQSIYAFRGARIENILNFQNDYPNYQTFKLEQNYRSTQNIVNAANSVIAKNRKQLKKEVFSKNEDGDRIKLMQAVSDTEEGSIVINELSNHALSMHDPYSEYAILYRTNAQSRIFEEALRKLNIPYKIYGGLSFYERKEIKDVLAYLRLIVNPNDGEAFKRVINYPARGIGKTTLSKLEFAADTNGISLWEAATNPDAYHTDLNSGTIKKVQSFTQLIQLFQNNREKVDAYEFVMDVAKTTGIMEDLYREKTPENLSRFENVQELLNAIQDFTLNALEEGRPNKLENYLEEVALITDHDSDDPDDRNKVSLMTVHAAKGLEFNNVFIVGVEDQLFPSNFSGFISPENLEEERRLFYVAITRARKKVWISFSKQRYNWGQLVFSDPSRFIEDIDPEFLDMPSFMRSDMRYTSSNTGTTNRVMKGAMGKPKEPEPKPTQQPASHPLLKRKLTSIRDTKKKPGFAADDPSLIQPGIQVEHQRFGKGKVLQIEGEAPDIKATIFFQSSGQKQLLLKFAKLKIIKSE